MASLKPVTIRRLLHSIQCVQNAAQRFHQRRVDRRQPVRNGNQVGARYAYIFRKRSREPSNAVFAAVFALVRIAAFTKLTYRAPAVADARSHLVYDDPLANTPSLNVAPQCINRSTEEHTSELQSPVHL